MNFKESKIPGVGLIPSHWIESKWRYVTDILTDYTANGSFGDLAKNVTYLNEPDYARLIRLTDLRTNLENEGLYVNKHSYDYLKKSALYGGEFLIANVGANAGLVLEMPKLDVRATLGPNMMLARFDFNKVLSKYMLYIANSEYIQTQLILKATASSAQPKLNKEDFRSIQFLLPPMDEQERIVRYLDGKLPDIDIIIRKLNKKISLLEQQRQSIITEAVAKGLNPNVKMKESGVEWIGEIPEHWKVSKLKYHSIRVGDGLHGTPTYDDQGEYYFINGNNLGEISIKVNEKNYKVNEEEFISHGQKIRENTILISLNGTIGNVSVYNNEKIMLSKSAGYISLENDVDVLFVYHWLKNVYVENYFTQSFAGTTIKNLSLETLRNTPILMMPLNEQKEIANYLKGKIKDTNFIIGEVKNQIENLKEYRQALIYEAVTGKIDVRYMELD